MTSAERDERKEEDEDDEPERCFWKSAGSATHNIVIPEKSGIFRWSKGQKRSARPANWWGKCESLCLSVCWEWEGEKVLTQHTIAGPEEKREKEEEHKKRIKFSLPLFLPHGLMRQEAVSLMADGQAMFTDTQHGQWDKCVTTIPYNVPYLFGCREESIHRTIDRSHMDPIPLLYLLLSSLPSSASLQMQPDFIVSWTYFLFVEIRENEEENEQGTRQDMRMQSGCICTDCQQFSLLPVDVHMWIVCRQF